MDWAVAFLEGADADIARLSKAGVNPSQVQAAVKDQFTGFKGDRVQKLLESGTASSAIDRLESSAFPTSIRLQVLQDLRATAWIIPVHRQVVVVHVFPKSQDPDYRRAGPTHDQRLIAYIETFHAFAQKRKK